MFDTESVVVAEPPVDAAVYVLPADNKNLSFICSHFPPNNVSGDVLETLINIAPTG